MKHSICRACLLEGDQKEYLNLHMNINALDEKLTYIECFQQCTQINIKREESKLYQQTDLLANIEQICLNCAAELINAYNFIKKAQNSDKTLRMKLNIKIEQDIANESEPFEWIAMQEKELEFDSDGICLAEVPTAKEFNVTADRLSDCEESRILSNNVNVKLESETKLNSVISNKSLSHSLIRRSCGISNDEEVRKVKCVPSLIKRKRGRPGKNIVEGTQEHTRKKSTATKLNVQERVCEYCDKSFPYKEMKRHLLLVHKRKPLLCQACPRTFSNVFNLRQHESIHEENRERNFICDKCGKKFFTRLTYKNHVKTHDSSRKAIFHCDECSKSFLHKGNLTLHKLKHDGPKIECKVCQKRYVRLADFEVHLRSHSGDLPYKCSKCDKAFTQSSSLNRHIRQHEGFRYKCDICDKDYEHQSTLKQHEASHTGLPVKCGICERGFATKYRITRHISMVHKIKEANEIGKQIIRDESKSVTKQQTAEES